MSPRELQCSERECVQSKAKGYYDEVLELDVTTGLGKYSDKKQVSVVQYA